MILVAAALSVAGVLDTLLAQGGPFGSSRPSGPAPQASSGFVGWILAKQTEFNLAMRSLIRQAKADGSAVWGLLGISFLYGVFHAAGPGHGKAVISSYVVANEETWKRGVVLSFASALLQAVVAVTFVVIARLVLNATQKMMCNAEYVIEVASYALIALIGLRLLWVKGRALVTALRNLHPPTAVGAAVTPAEQRSDHGAVGSAAAAHADHPHHRHDHHGGAHHEDAPHGHDHARQDHAHHDHAHDNAGHDQGRHHHGHHHHDHDDHASAWGHAHAPEPQELAGPGGWQRGLAAIVAVGLRPCSGAIIVLVFSLSQGLFWAGVASTFTMAIGTAITVAAIATVAVTARSFAQGIAQSRSGYGTAVMRGIEVAAAAVILAFGALLLSGYLFSERLPLC